MKFQEGVLSLLNDGINKYPDKYVLFDRFSSITFNQLKESIILNSQNLTRLCVSNNDRVILFLDNSIEYIEAYFSIIKPGYIKAWKLHKKMTMNIVVPIGSVQFVFYDKNKELIIRFSDGKAETKVTKVSKNK